jgi:hypothetical protein
LQLKRLRYQAGAETFLGHAAASHNQSLPRIWFDAQSAWEEDVDEAMYAVNSARADARVSA